MRWPRARDICFGARGEGNNNKSTQCQDDIVCVRVRVPAGVVS